VTDYRSGAARLTGFSLGSQWVAYHHGESGDALFRRTDGSAYAKVATGSGVALLDDERRRTAWLSPFKTRISHSSRLAGVGRRRVPRDKCRARHSGRSARSSRALKAWPSIAARLRDLHAIPAKDCPFDRGLQTMFDRAPTWLDARASIRIFSIQAITTRRRNLARQGAGRVARTPCAGKP
jgi:streptomycin 3"-kinase